MHATRWHRAPSLEDQESVGVVRIEVQYACAQLTSLYPRRHSRDKISQALSRFSMSRGSKVARLINAHSGDGLGTRLYMYMSVYKCTCACVTVTVYIRYQCFSTNIFRGGQTNILGGCRL